MSKKSIAYIGNRDTGKTTRLYNIFLDAIRENKKVLVIDSATEHTEKSLYEKLQLDYGKRSFSIRRCKREQIVFPDKSSDYPKINKNVTKNIYLADVSYYLEKGYEYPAGQKRENERLLYKKQSMQIIDALMEQIDVILMDEIELVREGRYIIQKIQSRDIELFMTLHSDSGLCEMEDLFDIVRV